MSAFLASPLGFVLTVVLVFAALFGPLSWRFPDASRIDPELQPFLAYLSIVGVVGLVVLRVLSCLLG